MSSSLKPVICSHVTSDARLRNPVEERQAAGRALSLEVYKREVFVRQPHDLQSCNFVICNLRNLATTTLATPWFDLRPIPGETNCPKCFMALQLEEEVACCMAS